MASSYITSDGKDLDERYLGIDAKAKSAASVNWEDINNTPVLWTKLNWNTAVSVSSKGSWTVPSNGLTVIDNDRRVNSKSVNYVSTTVSGLYSDWVSVRVFTSVPVLVSVEDVINSSGSFYLAV